MNALKKINARVKALQKKHPKAKRTTLQKQAGREWKAGKLKVKRKAAKAKPVKRKPAKRKTAKRRVTLGTILKAKVSKVGKRRRYTVKLKTKRRVSGRVGKKDSIMPIVAIAGIGILAYMLLRPQQQPPPLQYSSNQQRNNSANNILQYAMAAGMTIAAITALINAINNAPDHTVIEAAQNPATAVQQFLA